MMTDHQSSSTSILAPAASSIGESNRSMPGQVARAAAAKSVARMVPGLLAAAAFVGVVATGMRADWRMPKFSMLFGSEQVTDDWCAEHSVPESRCVECIQGCLPRGKEFGWCKQHGVPECPLCHPEVAQLDDPYVVSPDDLERAARSLAFAPRTPNNSRCASHHRRIQLASADIASWLEIEVAPVRHQPITEAVTANGEVSFDATRVARIAARSPGILWQVMKQAGDKVQKGDLLALVDSADVGKAKMSFQQALFELATHRQNLEKVRSISGSVVARQRLDEAQAEAEKAQVRLLAARQSLVNFGLPARIEDYGDLEPSEVTARLQFLGIDGTLAAELAQQTASSNLLPIISPLDGEILSRAGTAGETVDVSNVLFVVADTSRVWLTLNVRMEDAVHIEAGQTVQFTHQGHDDWDEGRVVWVSPAADERTRTIPVRVELRNIEGRHHAQTFGTARILLREEPQAIVVPSSAVHWDGDCHVVFVRDKNYDLPDSPKVFHVRKVRPGAKDVIGGHPVTEISVGLLPGEMIACANSGILRSELLKNNLGAG
jgi:cobalt-zinc-cadmium efflux system membrane fusion protein